MSCFDTIIWLSAKENKLSPFGIEDIEPTFKSYEDILNTILHVIGFEYEKNEKGIIGIGTIISNVYKDKDFIKNIEQTNFVDLKFMNLSTIPFISLKELESIDPNINWTPENNGNHIPNSTYEKIFNKINKKAISHY